VVLRNTCNKIVKLKTIKKQGQVVSMSAMLTVYYSEKLSWAAQIFDWAAGWT